MVKRALSKGPQGITLARREPVAALILRADYIRLTQPKLGFAAFMRQSPLRGLDFDAERPSGPTREVER